MTFLKDRESWKKWVKEDMAGQEGVEEPVCYPCYSYTSVGSFGYEEYKENYLYENDVDNMLVKLVTKR